MKIKGMPGTMTAGELKHELDRGSKFILFYYCISVIIVSFRRSSIWFVRPGEKPLVKGLPYSLLSVLLGWWGIPWGPIYTVQSLYTNFRGGKDVTKEVVDSVVTGYQKTHPQAAQPAAGAATQK